MKTIIGLEWAVNSAFIIMLLAMVFMFPGCSMLTPSPDFSLKDYANINLESDSKKIQESAEIIDQETKSQVIKKEAVKLLVIANMLLQKHQIYQKLLELTEDLKEEIEHYKDGERRRVMNLFFSGIVTGFLILLGGATLFIISHTSVAAYNMSGLGVLLMVIGASIAVLSGVAYFYFMIAVIIGGCLLLLLGIYAICDRYKQGQFNCDMARTDEIRRTVKNTEEADKAVSIVQSPGTQKTLLKIKKKDNLNNES